jgi:TatD DNase family protein
MEKPKLQFYDIAANLSDDQFKGIYNGKSKHPEDYQKIFQRCQDFNVSHLLIASGNIPDLDASYTLCKRSENYFTTAGVHPCRANEAVENIDEYFQNLENKIKLYQDKGMYAY